LEAFPDPAGDVLCCRVLEALDLIQIEVIELLSDGKVSPLDIAEVDHPTQLWIQISFHPDPHPVRVSMETTALVVF